MRKPITSGVVVILLAVIASFAAEEARMKVASSAFQEGGNIPSKFTCDGSETRPPLQITGVPSEAKSLVLIADDQDALSGLFTQWLICKIGKRAFDVSRHGLIMGVLNVTPDSFSDGGEFLTADKATERGLQMAVEGAHIIDIGGESTRPGSEPVTADEELRRVIPVIENLRRKLDVPVSIDTSKAEVARAGIQAGASIVNDVTGGRGDDQMLPLVAETNSAFVTIHMQETPRTMQIAPRYTDIVAQT